MIWAWINVIAGCVCIGIITHKLVCKLDRFTPMESIGMGLTGAGMLLTFGPILSTSPTPYEDWSGTLLRFGIAVYFVGRQLRHRHNNASAVKQARRHFALRTKGEGNG